MTRPGATGPGAVATAALAVPGRWAERALCAQAYPDAWFTDKCQRELTQLATRICARYPVRAQCLDWALSGANPGGGIATGIWGGPAPQERGQIQQQRKPVAA